MHQKRLAFPEGVDPRLQLQFCDEHQHIFNGQYSLEHSEGRFQHTRLGSPAFRVHEDDTHASYLSWLYKAARKLSLSNKEACSFILYWGAHVKALCWLTYRDGSSGEYKRIKEQWACSFSIKEAPLSQQNLPIRTCTSQHPSFCIAKILQIKSTGTQVSP